MAEFDPDAYLKKKGAAPAGFDPDAYLSQRKPVQSLDPSHFGNLPPPMEDPVPQVGAGETFVNRAVNALPFGRPVVDTLSTGVMQGAKALGVGSPGVTLTPQAMEEAQAAGIGIPERRESVPGVMDTYRQMRDTRDVRTDAGSEQNPWAGRLGTGAGIALTALAPLPKSLGGAGVGVQGARAAAAGGRGLPQAMKAGALLGGVQALGDSRADLTRGEVLPAAVDTALGTALGTVGGAAGYGAGVHAPPLLRRARQWLQDRAVAQGRRVLLNGADSLSNRTTSDEAVMEAIRSGAIRPLGTTQGAAQRLESLTDEVGAAYNAIVEGLEKQGVQGPVAAELADELVRRGAALETQTMNEALPRAFMDSAEQTLGKAGNNPRLGLTQAESLKRSLQQQARYGRTEETPLNEVRREVASVFRQANEDAISAAGQAAPPNSEVAQMAEEFVPVKQRLGRLIEAEKAANRGAQKASNRAAFGLKDYMLASGTGDPVTGGAVAVGSRLMSNRGPSTAASGSYYTSQLARYLADAATLGNARGTLPGASARLISAAERDALAPLLPEYAERETPEQQRARALAEALRQRR